MAQEVNRREFFNRLGPTVGGVALAASGVTLLHPAAAQGRAVSSGSVLSRSQGGVGSAHATVERVHIPKGAAELHAHLIVNAAIHHTSKLGAGSVDIGAKVTLIYRSGGKLVTLKSARTDLGALDAKGIDSQSVRVIVRVPYGGQRPDPGTHFAGRAQLFTRLPGNVDVPFGPAA
jgi:hypothetical protein